MWSVGVRAHLLTRTVKMKPQEIHLQFKWKCNEPVVAVN